MTRLVGPLALLALVMTTAGFSLLHNRLVRSEPARDATVAAPAVIHLWFAERAEPGLSTIAVVGADSSRVAVGKVRRGTSDTLALEADVTGPMKPGTYQVRWRTSGADGHVIRGSYPFRVQ